jgi:prophage regulatory protein
MQSPSPTPSSPQLVADEIFLSDKAVASMVDVSQSTIWIWTRAGKFPRPIRLADVRCTRWRKSEVIAWMRAQQDSEPRQDHPGQVALRRKRAERAPQTIAKELI